MTYKDILNEQKKLLRKDLNWWPTFLYHFTDVHNASSILCNGWIYSREEAEKQKIMVSDNASRAVLDATNVESKSYGRLYFRPLTPTQYHNEGYKPVEVRKSDINASCPVPIFFCLNAGGVLEYEGTKFAERGIAGHRHNIKSGVEEFQNLDFRKIYHEGPMGMEHDIMEYRHSEVIREGGFPIEPFLQCVLCRSQAERETFMFLLKQYSARLYNTYKDKIWYKPTLKCFYNNGIFLKSVFVEDGHLKLTFNDVEQRMKSGSYDLALELDVELVYKKRDGRIVNVNRMLADIKYNVVRSGTILLNSDMDYDILGVKIWIDGVSMYENEISVVNELF